MLSFETFTIYLLCLKKLANFFRLLSVVVVVAAAATVTVVAVVLAVVVAMVVVVVVRELSLLWFSPFNILCGRSTVSALAIFRTLCSLLMFLLSMSFALLYVCVLLIKVFVCWHTNGGTSFSNFAKRWLETLSFGIKKKLSTGKMLKLWIWHYGSNPTHKDSYSFAGGAYALSAHKKKKEF